VDETDTVTVRTVLERRLAFMVGGGVKYPLGGRTSLRVDVRDHIYRDPQRTELDATPVVQPTSSGLTFGSTPRLSFGSSPFARSTLGGSAVSSFETYRARGVQQQIAVTVGLSWRF
jgi:hypothetical protein